MSRQVGQPVDASPALAVLLWPVPDAQGRWPDFAATARSARRLPASRMHIAGDARVCGLAAGERAEPVPAADDLREVLLGLGPGCDVLVVRAPVQFQGNLLDRALGWARADPRVATVGVLNSVRGLARVEVPEGMGTGRPGLPSAEAVHERLLRHVALPAAVVPLNDGPVVLFTASALSTALTLALDPCTSVDVQLLEAAVAWERKGFVHLLDPQAYVHLPRDTGGWEPGGSVLQEVAPRHPAAVAHAAREVARRDSPLSVAMCSVRARLQGLRVGVDGTCLGPMEMGTQTQTLAVVEALSRHEGVTGVVVAVGGGVPPYACRVLSLPGVSVRQHCGDDISQVGVVDVLHRPFQPHGALDVSGWRRVAGRAVLTVQDLIAYQIGSYHRDETAWEAYRTGLRAAVRDVDGVVAISDDTVQALAREQLPVEQRRVFLSENGTDHLSGREQASVPPEMLAPGRVARPFLLVLGADYSHKNRDLAVAAHARLSEVHGEDVLLVLCGAEVPYGSSRSLENRVPRDDARVVDLPDVTSAERNWLLRHAAVALYPTSNEGFGLVPYEAARFGTPTVLVPFGPLARLGHALPVVAEDWSPSALARATAAYLGDPRLGDTAVARTLQEAAHWTWARTADCLVDAYHAVLAIPPRGEPPTWSRRDRAIPRP